MTAIARDNPPPRRKQSAHIQSWQMDPQLPDAALAGRLRMADLSAADEAFVVLSLWQRGETVDLIAQRLQCSRRRVQQVKASPLGVIFGLLLEAQANAERSERRQVESDRERDLAERCAWLESSRGQLIDQLAQMRRRLDLAAV